MGAVTCRLAILIALLCSACDRPGSRPVVIFSAASAAPAMARLADRIEAAEGVRIVVSASGSSALGAQLIQGAPADLFLSASPDWTDAVADAGLVARSQALLSNQLVLVAPAGNPAELAGLHDLLHPQVKRVALAGEAVPAGVYAGQALGALGLLEDLETSGRIVRGSDVRAALAYAERAEVEAAIVYVTDARASPSVEIVCAIDPALHDPILYPLALLAGPDRHPGAGRVYEALLSPGSVRVFLDAGFLPAPAP
ncbi:MAG: molybdate ABC transporter substrate-binding protein [Phycisphaerales bacterium JB039]